MTTPRPRRLTPEEKDRLRRHREQIASELPDLAMRDRKRKEASKEKTLNGELRRAVHSSSLSLSMIAKRADISPLVLDEFLTGERTLQPDVLERLAAVLGFARGKSIAAGVLTKEKLKKACSIVLLPLLVGLVIFAITACGFLCVYYHFVNKYNPSYHGKRVQDWADQAIWDENPAARSEAVEVLIVALRGMEDEPRTHLLMLFCYPKKGEIEKKPLPKEVIPFLLEGLRLSDQHNGGYAVMALVAGEGPETVPTLQKALAKEEDPDQQGRIRRMLELLTQKNKSNTR
jgi:hypothetical protein